MPEFILTGPPKAIRELSEDYHSTPFGMTPAESEAIRRARNESKHIFARAWAEVNGGKEEKAFAPLVGNFGRVLPVLKSRLPVLKAGGPCDQGQTAAQTGCTPESGEEGQKPSEKPPSGEWSWADKLPSHDSWKDLPPEPGYVYHATNKDRAAEIQEGGMVPHRPSFGTDQRGWPDGSRELRSYFTPKPATAWMFAPEEGEPALLRIRRSNSFRTESGTGDVYLAGKRVPSHMLEILTQEGWKPVRNQPQKSVRKAAGIAPEIATPQDVAPEYVAPFAKAEGSGSVLPVGTNAKYGSEPGFVWRVQPIGSELHGQRSLTSSDEEIEGVFVFDNIGELAAIDWANESNVELVKIKVDNDDLFETEDQEGMGLEFGKGEIVGRREFDDIRSLRQWAIDLQRNSYQEPGGFGLNSTAGSCEQGQTSAQTGCSPTQKAKRKDKPKPPSCPVCGAAAKQTDDGWKCGSPPCEWAWEKKVEEKGWVAKAGGSCGQGETAAQTGCTPANGDGGKESSGKGRSTSGFDEKTDAYLKEQAQSSLQKLSAAQRGALDDYTTGMSVDLNQAIRDGTLADDRDLSDTARQMDSAFAATPPLPKPVQVYRGMNFATPEALQVFVGSLSQPSGSVTMSTYPSASADLDVAVGYLKDRSGEANAGSVLLEIEASHGIYVEGVSRVPGSKGEREFIMPRGGQFQVVGSGEQDVGGRKVRVFKLRQTVNPAKGKQFNPFTKAIGDRHELHNPATGSMMSFKEVGPDKINVSDGHSARFLTRAAARQEYQHYLDRGWTAQKPYEPASIGGPARTHYRSLKSLLPVIKSRDQEILDMVERNGNFMHLVDLGQRLGLAPTALHSLVQHLRRVGRLTVASHEGRHGITPSEQQYLMDDRPGSGDRLIGYVMVRR